MKKTSAVQEPALRVVGKGLRRFEGRAKVTGRARYAADNALPDVVYACGVFSTRATGKVAAMDVSVATAAPGVLGIWHHGNTPTLYRSPNDMKSGTRVGEVRLPFEDDRVHYAGQFIAVVAAKTFEQAREAARLVSVRYAGESVPVLSIPAAIAARGSQKPKSNGDVRRGEPEQTWTDAAVKIDATFATPPEIHTAMELHATVAAWHDSTLEIWDSTQWVVGQQQSLAAIFGIPPEQVTVHAPYIGGGFGGKLFLWPHTVVAALVSAQLKSPVKLTLDRSHVFTTAGHRPATRQRVRLGATADGRLVSVFHDTVSHTSSVHEFVESCGSTTASLYECADLSVTQRLAIADVGTPTPMRAPGAASGTFALECALDELAVSAAVDPIELRLKNIARRDAADDLPWSSNFLGDCLRDVRDRFGWARRNPVPGSQRDGDEILGWGTAVASWPSEAGAATIRVQLFPDGTARVSCATQDIGTGTYTVIEQVAAEVLGLPMGAIDVAIGHSTFPDGPISGGSMVTATIVPVIARACRAAREALFHFATGRGGAFQGGKIDALQLTRGSISAGGKTVPIREVLATAHVECAQAEASTIEGGKFAFRSFGAHCVEVRWHPGLARLRVSKISSTFDAGRVINRLTAINQIHGSLLMGLGMALLEEAVYDPQSGRVINDNLADYLVPVHADTPAMDVHFLDRPDPHIGEFGAKGIGEVGITGLPAAIANAVFHATGRRFRTLPIKIEDLLLSA